MLEQCGDDLELWGACQRLIDSTLRFINQEGLSSGTSDRLRAHLVVSMEASWSRDETFERVSACLLQFVLQSEQELDTEQRAWLMTEIPESHFRRFKRLEGQHNKGGFTGRLAAIPALCGKVDGPQVRRHLLEVDANRLKQWSQTTIGRTLTARRTEALKELKTAMNG